MMYKNSQESVFKSVKNTLGKVTQEMVDNYHDKFEGIGYKPVPVNLDMLEKYRDSSGLFIDLPEDMDYDLAQSLRVLNHKRTLLSLGVLEDEVKEAGWGFKKEFGKLASKFYGSDWEKKSNIDWKIWEESKYEIIKKHIHETPFLQLLSEAYPWIIGLLVTGFSIYLYTKNPNVKKVVDDIVKKIIKGVKNIAVFLWKVLKIGYKSILIPSLKIISKAFSSLKEMAQLKIDTIRYGEKSALYLQTKRKEILLYEEMLKMKKRDTRVARLITAYYKRRT